MMTILNQNDTNKEICTYKRHDAQVGPPKSISIIWSIGILSLASLSGDDMSSRLLSWLFLRRFNEWEFPIGISSTIDSLVSVVVTEVVKKNKICEMKWEVTDFFWK